MPDFRGGPVDRNLPDNEEDMGSIPGPGRSHLPQSNEPHATHQRGQTGLKRRGLELRKVLRAASEETVAHPPPPRNPQLPEGVSAKHFKGKRSGAWLVVTKFWVQES